MVESPVCVHGVFFGSAAEPSLVAGDSGFYLGVGVLCVYSKRHLLGSPLLEL